MSKRFTLIVTLVAWLVLFNSANASQPSPSAIEADFAIEDILAARAVNSMCKVDPNVMDEINGPNVSPGMHQWTNALYSTLEANFRLNHFYGIRATSRLEMTAWGGFRCS
jgi:hypothetical protein